MNVVKCLILLCISQSSALDNGDYENGSWVDIWTAMPQLTEYSNLPTGLYVSMSFGF